LPETELLSVAGIGTTPFGRDRWFRHPVSIPVAGIGVPVRDEVVLFGKPKFHFRCRSFIWDDGVPTPSILVIGIPASRFQNISLFSSRQKHNPVHMEKKEFYRKHLPHFQQAGQVYFVTWCLKDAIPPKQLEIIPIN